MKLQAKIAGLCGSAAFLITSFPGFYQQTRPTDFSAISTNSFSGMAIFETLSISIVGAIAVGMIGYAIGDILCKPQGKAKAHPPKVQPEVKQSPAQVPGVDPPAFNQVEERSPNPEASEIPLIPSPEETAPF